MKITTKLISLGLFPIIIVLISACINIYTLYKSNQATKTYLNQYIDRQIRVTEILRFIGYGKGIHNFKNYILRGTEDYRERFVKNYTEANNLIKEYLALEELSSQEKKTMEVLLAVNNEYLDKLPIADELIVKHLPVREIDIAVKVNDKPAEKELENLHRYFTYKKAQAIKDLKSTQNRISFQALGVLFLALILSFITNNRVAKKMLNSITKLGSIAQDVSRGKYENSKLLESFSEDELKSLGVQLVEMGRVLEMTITNLKKSNEDLEQFAFVASHDLQEPIKKIAMFSDLLDNSTKDKLSQDEALYLSKVKLFSQEMIDLIRSLLSYAKMSDVIHVEEQVDLNLLIQEFSNNEQFKSLVIESEKLPLVLGNKKTIKIVLEEIFSNAMKFKKTSESAKLKISATQSDGKVLFTLQDFGIGFNNEYKDLIFKPFGRAHNKNDFSGAGIGLSVIKKILDAHESTYSLTGVENEGTTFKFTLKVVHS